MSIITDALRKAEEERELKTKRTVEKVLVQADFEQAELLKRFGYATLGAEAPILSSKPLRIKPPVNIFAAFLQKISVSVLLVLVCFFVVYLVPRWLINPGSFSEDWSFFKNDAFSRISLLIPAVSPPENISTPSEKEVALAPSQPEEPHEGISAPAPLATEGLQKTVPVPIVEAQPVPIMNKEPETSYVLSGISVMGDDRYAVVNGSIVQKGDSIDGAYIKEILDREVILETRSAEIKLKIPS